jgi:Trp operon repressor
MVNYKMLVALFLTLFVWQGVADAASISTRVRIIEGKLANQNSKIRQSETLRQAQDSKIDRSLAKVKALDSRVDKLLEEGLVNDKFGRDDKRYAFP